MMSKIIDPEEIRAAAKGSMYETEFNDLADEIARLQARIDALMLEHCQDGINTAQAAISNNIEIANQIAAAAEKLGSIPCPREWSQGYRNEMAQHITNLRRIAQELAGSRGGELYPLPACDEA